MMAEPDDPIFAAIEAHTVAYKDYIAAMKRQDAEDADPGDSQALYDAVTVASGVEAEAMAEMLETGPATLAGARALVRHLSNVEDGCLPQEPRELVECLLRSPLFAA